MQPAIFVGRLESPTLPITCGDVFSPHENFAVVGQLEFAARKNLAHRTFRRTERMIQADERRGFGHSVSLNDGVAHSLEETFRVIRKRRATGEESPEFPAKTAMDAPKHPRAPKEFSSVGSFEPALEPLGFPL